MLWSLLVLSQLWRLGALTLKTGERLGSCKPFEPREGEPRQPNKAYFGL